VGRAKLDADKMNNIAKAAVLSLLRGYKCFLSPMLAPACRYTPTCSEYAMESVDRFGAVRGSWMAFKRILRCHPFVRGGYDPVVAPDTPARRAGVDKIVCGH
jgi:uncharacterized protein